MAEEDAAAAAAAGAQAVQLIDGEGEFTGDSSERFMTAAGVSGCGLSHAVVSIMARRVRSMIWADENSYIAVREGRNMSPIDIDVVALETSCDG
ncbi:protein ROOT HAIR DEFECTIVE 31 [Hordeum vulgare]|nr:protein ROOT HAIR DEFECTIVE 31 [Hordeum vulgare]